MVNMRYTVLITRHKIKYDYSLGKCYIKDTVTNELEYIASSLERGWRDNQNRVSCVPEGVYNLKLEYSPRFRKDLWELYGVPNRSECKFHAANYWYQLNGCIALGTKDVWKDIDGDGRPDVTNSRAAMKLFHEKLLGQQFSQVEIRNLV